MRGPETEADASPKRGARAKKRIEASRFARVDRTVWRGLLTEFKKRKAVAAQARMAAPAPAVPSGRNWLPLGPTLVLNGQTVGNQPLAGRVSGLAVAVGV